LGLQVPRPLQSNTDIPLRTLSRHLSPGLCDILAFSVCHSDLKLDLSTIKELVATGKFSSWKTGVEEREHSLEMHLPYIYKMLSNHFKSVDEFPPLVPILVGNTSPTVEKAFGKLLAPYLADPTSVFIVSSDFCHWGDNFDYKYYLHPPTPKLPAKGDASKPTSEDHELTEPPAGVSIHYLGPRDQHLIGPPIYESIEYLDTMTMNAIKTGKHEVFLNNLRKTGNTVCGRHPIGVVMAALEILNAENKFSEKGNGRFEFLRYERSSMVEKINGSSVSYVSAVAIL